MDGDAMLKSMRKTITQIYEVQNPREAEALGTIGIDHIGSVLTDETSWKNSDILETIQVSRQTGARGTLIPLLQNRTTLFRALDYYHPDIVHFCEALSPFPAEQDETIRACDAMLNLQMDVKNRYPQIEVMRSLSVPQTGWLKTNELAGNILSFAKRLAPFSDYFLIDTLLVQAKTVSRQPVSGYVGITGKICDWNLAKIVIENSPLPVILAGGLSAENVYNAVRSLKPAGVDSCTQTNAYDQNGHPVRFKKDMEKVRLFVQEVRRADLRLLEYSSPDKQSNITENTRLSPP
jgi:phosphoribosylanthranilate isomerase